MVGSPGRKIEAAIGNARIADTDGKKWYDNSKTSTTVPLRVKGVDMNVIIDKGGDFFDDDKLYQLLLKGVSSKAGDFPGPVAPASHSSPTKGRKGTNHTAKIN